MSRNQSANLIALAAVGVVIAMIGMVAYFSSRLIGQTVTEQFRTQELQLVSSLSQQTETYFTGLNADLTSLSLQPEIKTTAVRDHTAGVALMAEHAELYPGVIRSIIRFDYQGATRYGWPPDLNESLEAGDPSPYNLPSRLVDQTRSGESVPLDVELIPASRRGEPDSSAFLLIAPVYTRLDRTEFVVYELDVKVLFATIMNLVDLASDGQLWVIDSTNTLLFQANSSMRIDSLLEKIPLAVIVSFREPSAREYHQGGDNRLAVIAPARAQGNSFRVILSRSLDSAQENVRSDLRGIFALTVGAILLIALGAGLALRALAQENNRRQEEARRRETARTLLEMARALNSTLNLEDVLRLIMGELHKLVPYDSAAVLLLDRSKLTIAAHRGTDTAEHQETVLELDQAHAANQVLQSGRPLVINDTQADERWKSLMPDSAIRSWMGVPLRVRDKTVGVLNMNSHIVGRFSAEEADMAGAFADQASVALQNAQLHQMEVTQIEQELTIARAIQESLLPSAAPDIPQLWIAAFSLPARQVSGDYFQYLPMPNGRLGIAVGDVSGKGIPAALFMAVISTALRDEAARNVNPAELLNALNERLLDRMKATHVNSALLVGMFDPATRHVELANAGMVQPYVWDGSEWAFVPVGGYPLGVSQRMAYTSQTVTLAPGAVLLVFSDGVIEAQNPAGEMYGFERLDALLNAAPHDLAPQALIDRIMGAVRAHLGDAEPQDDITIVAIRSVQTGREEA